MSIFDFYYKNKYKNTIENLGLNKPAGTFLLLPIENDDDGRRLSNHSIIINRETVNSLLKNISVKGSKDRFVYKSFSKWNEKHPTIEIAEISPILRSEARWLYLLLQKNFLNIETEFDFLCNDCNKVYQFRGRTVDSLTSKEEGYIAKENTPVRIYDVVYCPHKHLIYRRIRMYISP